METLTLHHPHFIEPNCTPPLYQTEIAVLKQRIKEGEFSFFSKPVTNTIPIRKTNVLEIYNLIVSEKYQHPTRVLRCLSDPARARSYKARNFDYICASGVFTKRSEQGLVQHSGLITIDFDHVPYPEKLKNKLIHDPNFTTAFAFTSPSGDGIKWLVEIDLERNTHLSWFLGLQAYIRTTYYLEIDKSGKDVSRCCFLPHDPQAYINPKYL